MNKNNNLIFCLWLLLFVSCTKSDFLSKKPNTSITIPSSVSDMMQLLDNQNVMAYNSPAAGFLSADEYYYPTKASYDASRTKTEKNLYIWNRDIYEGENNIPDWNQPYSAILYANVVLESWDKLSQVEKDSENGRFVKAWALFDRAFNYHNLVQTFSAVYDKSTANTDLGVPLKLTANVNEIKQRATLDQCYSQIIDDLTNAVNLFTITISSGKLNRPSKSSAYALLSRVYLYMRDYKKAGEYADSTLNLYNKLIDYNTLDVNSDIPFTLDNPEILFYNISNLVYIEMVVNYGSTIMDTTLVNFFSSDDLRGQVFFKVNKGDYLMKVGYNAIGGYPFTGLAIDEVYLTKAECEARVGNMEDAKNTLNTLLINRYKIGTYMPFDSNVKDEVLNKILLERRKELVWRGIRWQDIRRLNKEGANIILKRQVGDASYILAPNDPKYIMPIPDDEISLSHIQQNMR
ncbi:RagB/SusD family nutrient uptake outer membrane protein [Chitinophaga sp. 30R24]|uniref:RagB/SusD family nutrient uptake outer membrane protein n=1 Tax=Chitinophaga sp. 30R24 TaxID=3248838 RepID=UPI003B902295